MQCNYNFKDIQFVVKQQDREIFLFKNIFSFNIIPI